MFPLPVGLKSWFDTWVENLQLFYFAYGSNLHPARLGARIPSSRLMGRAQLPGYQLAFHKRGADLSAKCNAVFSGDLKQILPGALFSISSSEKPLLDDIEGAGYVAAEIIVEHAGKPHQAYMYIAEQEYIDDNLRPFQWYKDFVLLGARFLSFSDQHLQFINTVEAVEDDDLERRARNEQILRLMR